MCLSTTRIVQAVAFSDVTSKTYEKDAITQVVKAGWIKPVSTTAFGYGQTLSPDEWLTALMYFRTSDACPELGKTLNEYWTIENIRACLSGAGIPVVTDRPTIVRRDEAMQQLFALRRRSFAFQQLQTKPADFVEPLDLKDAPTNRQGALIAADRLKLLFRNKNKIIPDGPLLREDAALALTRFIDWERQGGIDSETNDRQALSKEAELNHWRDLDTDMYVIKVNLGGDTQIRPILPERSFNPSKDPAKEQLRDEFVYEPVSQLAEESGAIAAVNGSYFNVEWPWGALEDTAIVNGKTILERTDRSTFVVCKDGKVYVGKMDTKSLKALSCTPQQALGAGPLFISGGNVLTTSTPEGFDEYTQWERRVGKNARTAIAISADRKTVYVIVVAGKSYPAFGKGGSSLGSFLKSKYPDIAYAMMFDGGSSSALAVKNKLLVGAGVSGSNDERSVVSALGIFSHKMDLSLVAAFKKDQVKHWDKQPTQLSIERPATSTKTLVSSQPNKGTLSYTRKEQVHERGWRIPTELHVLNSKDGSDVDVLSLLKYIPADQRPDLKTFTAIAWGKTGLVFGDATGRAWFYYPKTQEFSPAKYKTTTKVVSKTTKATIKTK